MTQFTVTDQQRTSTGARRRILQFPDHASVVVVDWTEDERCGAFGSVDIHPSEDTADFRVSAHDPAPGLHRGFVAVGLASRSDVTLFLSPEQARTLATSILRAIDASDWVNPDRQVVGT